MSNRIIVTGIGTSVGKTVTAAILAEALGADYWKPVQAGDLDFSDTHVVANLLTKGETRCHPEAYRLNHPMSPHAAAKLDQVSIEADRLTPPSTSTPLIIEGAGGVMVPLSDSLLYLDLFAEWCKENKGSVVVVSQHYLGSINHTLLTLDVLLQRQIPIAGIVWNGAPIHETEEVILRRTPIKPLGRLLPEPIIDPQTIRKYANQWKPLLAPLQRNQKAKNSFV
jgi:dethiobiotin synthetase